LRMESKKLAAERLKTKMKNIAGTRGEAGKNAKKVEIKPSSLLESMIWLKNKPKIITKTKPSTPLDSI